MNDKRKRQGIIGVIGSKGYHSDYGGVEKVVYHICKGLHEQFRFIVFGSKSYYDVVEETPEEIEAFYFSLPKIKLSGAGILAFLGTLVALCRKVDIFYYHACGPVFFSFIPRLFGRKIIWHYHGADYLRAKTAYQLFSRERKYGQMVKQIWRYCFLRTGEWIGIHASDRVLVLGEANMKALSHDYARYSRRFIKINNFPFLEEGTFPISVELRNVLSEQFILSVSRLVSEKRIDLLIRAFRKISLIFPELYLVIIGEGDDAPNLKKHAEKHPRIIFTGYIPHQQLKAIYEKATLLCLCSTIEGQSLSILEACSCGCPALVSDIDTNLAFGMEFLFSFKVNDSEDLVQQLNYILAHDGERRMAGIGSQKWVEENYSRDGALEIVSKTCHQLLSNI